MITSSVTSPELATKHPPAHRCLPQHALFRWLYSRQELPLALPLDPWHQVARRHMRRPGDEQVDVALAGATLEDLDLRHRTGRAHDLCGAGGRRRRAAISCGIS